jgi:Icc-related predicted phosphoesterase
MIGKTLVINPGSLAEGRYGVLEIEKKDGLFTAKAELFDIKI